MTYEELDRRANQLAHYLVRLGVGPEVVVGVYQGRSLEQVVALLGVLKAGAAYLPLDPTHPWERSSDMLEDAGAEIVLVNGSAPNALRSSRLKLVDVAAEAHQISACVQSAPPTSSTPRNLAYVIYTSGSTGRAKGVAAIHQSIVNRVYAQECIGALKAGETCCQKTAVGFVDAVFEVFGALLSGCQLVIADEERGRDAQQLLRLLRSQQVQHLVSVPSLARALLESGEAQNLSALKHWTLSGEAFNGELLKELQEQLPSCEFANVYGCSEVGADASVCRCGAEAQPQWVSIGSALPNVQVYVLDELLQGVPVGVAGELYVGGAGLARGYVSRGALTAERFVPHPYEAGERLYRTGDWVRWSAEGQLQFIGRTDHQVKVRGYRIELGEIESVLMVHGAVRQAVVVVRENMPGQKRLEAYVVGAKGEVPASEELRKYLKQHLPDYMVPGIFVLLDSLPLNANGKVDRTALPHTEEQTQRPSYEPPRTSVEQALAHIWAQVLCVERVGLQDDFFELGGHSLVAISMMARVRSQLGLDVDLRVLFELPVLEGFSRRITAMLELLKSMKKPMDGVDDECEDDFI